MSSKVTGQKVINRIVGMAFVVGCLFLSSCGGIFNPAFVNTVSGGQFPLTPGPEASFILVRVVNETAQNAEFIVTIERDVIQRDDEGNPEIDDAGIVITRAERETKRLQTVSTAPGNELGVLFSCKESPINVIGLGDNLLPTDAALFLGTAGGAGGGGFGVPAESVDPLVREVGNFACGDTVVFRAILSRQTAGGVVVESFLLSGFNQPSVFEGPNTFVNLESFLESQVAEDG